MNPPPVPSPHTICAEDIALLSFLHTVPEPSQRCDLSSFRGRNDERTLPLERECDLASTLAFLAAISDDPNHVVAVCVEERVSSNSMGVMLAINKARPSSSQGTLDKARKGMQRIFQVLSKVSRGRAAQFLTSTPIEH